MIIRFCERGSSHPPNHGGVHGRWSKLPTSLLIFKKKLYEKFSDKGVGNKIGI